MRTFVLNKLLFVYNNFKKSEILRATIKKLIDSRKLKIKFHNFYIMAGINSAIESNLMFKEYNETFILKVIHLFASLNYNFVDIGANIGVHSLTASSANQDIEIFAFEPENKNYLNFINNISINNILNIRAFKMGLGDAISLKKLNLNEGWNEGKHSLKIDFDNSKKSVNIPVFKLDEFEKFLKFDSLAIKIDVEGFELEVIRGSKIVFNQIDEMVLIIELIIEISTKETCETIFKELEELNFSKKYKIVNNKSIQEVYGFGESGDYIFIKGEKTKSLFIDSKFF